MSFFFSLQINLIKAEGFITRHSASLDTRILVNIVLCLDGKDQTSQLLTGKCRQLLTLAVSLLENVSYRLFHGNIEISMLNVILGDPANFATVYQTMQENSQVSEEDAKRMTTRITRALQRRKKELDQFHEMHGHLKSLVLFCMDFPGSILSSILYFYHDCVWVF